MSKPFLPVSHRKPSAANLTCVPVWKGLQGSLRRVWRCNPARVALECCAGNADLVWAGFGERWRSGARSCGNWGQQNGKVPGRENNPTKPLCSGHSM